MGSQSVFLSLGIFPRNKERVVPYLFITRCLILRPYAVEGKKKEQQKNVLFALIHSCFHLPWRGQTFPGQAGPIGWEILGKPVWWCGCQCRTPSPALPKPAGPKGPLRRGKGPWRRTPVAVLSPFAFNGGSSAGRADGAGMEGCQPALWGLLGCADRPPPAPQPPAAGCSPGCPPSQSRCAGWLCWAPLLGLSPWQSLPGGWPARLPARRPLLPAQLEGDGKRQWGWRRGRPTLPLRPPQTWGVRGAEQVTAPGPNMSLQIPPSPHHNFGIISQPACQDTPR